MRPLFAGNKVFRAATLIVCQGMAETATYEYVVCKLSSYYCKVVIYIVIHEVILVTAG